MPVDIVIPCATQNELDVEDAVMIVANNVRYYVEAANMPATAEALRLLRLSPKILTAGSKASGSGGVVVSALEMVQNSLRYSWTRQEVDSRRSRSWAASTMPPPRRRRSTVWDTT